MLAQNMRLSDVQVRTLPSSKILRQCKADCCAQLPFPIPSHPVKQEPGIEKIPQAMLVRSASHTVSISVLLYIDRD